MQSKTYEVTIIVCSPHDGAGVRLAQHIAEGVQEAGATATVLKLSDFDIAPCDGCNGCLPTGSCIKEDDFGQVLQDLDGTDALVLISPVYFAGPPSQLKAFYDRFQERWVCRYVLGQSPRRKRPAVLCMTRTGSDPFGYEPLVVITRSVLNIAGFHLQDVHDFVGYGGDPACMYATASAGPSEASSEGDARERQAREVGQHLVASLHRGDSR